MFDCLCDTELCISCGHVAEFNVFDCLCDTELYISCAHVAEFNAFDCLCDTELCISCAHVAEFNVWTREAGAGGLSIAVEGPSRAEISFEERKDGSCGVSYVAQEPGIKTHTTFLSCAPFEELSFLKQLIFNLFAGDYEVSIKFNDEHVPDSPYLVPVYAPVDDARRLTVTSLQVRHEETSTHRHVSAAIPLSN